MKKAGLSSSPTKTLVDITNLFWGEGKQNFTAIPFSGIIWIKFYSMRMTKVKIVGRGHRYLLAR
jgi:hypothetical protein